MQNYEDLEYFYTLYACQQMAFLYEIPTINIRHILPSYIQPLEVRPGISLLFMGFNKFYAGNIIWGEETPDFYEFTRGIAVQPSLELELPLPRFTVFVYFVGSNYKRFVQHDGEVLFMPTFYSSTQTAKYDEQKTSVRVLDKYGPIKELRNTNPNTKYEQDTFYVQYYTQKDNKIYCGIAYEKTLSCLHQKKGDGGRIYDHPCFSEFEKNIPKNRPLEPYMQIFTKFDELAIQSFCKPMLIKDLNN